MIFLRAIWNSVLDPRNFLTASISVAILSMLVSYIEVQFDAERELALRQGSPVPVAVQDFSPMYNVGPASEVLVYGEVNLDLAQDLVVSEDAAAGELMVVPVFPLSDAGTAIVQARGTGTDEAPAPSTQSNGANLPNALALVVLPKGAQSVANEAYFTDSVLGWGSFGKVVLLNGQRARPLDDVSSLARDSLLASGIALIEGFLVIDPFLSGRIAALTIDETRHSKLIMWFAVALLALATLLQLRTSMQPAPEYEEYYEDYEDEDPYYPMDLDDADAPKSAKVSNFAPIPSQSEIRAAEAAKAEAEREPHWTETTYAALGRIGSVLAAFAGRIKSRRLRQEDEAL